MHVTDKHFREWEQDCFGYGYGTGEAYILPALQQFFAGMQLGSVMSYDAETVEVQVGGLAAWLLINALARSHIITYGTSPRHGVLTPQGERLRTYVLSKTPEELYAIATTDFDYDDPLCSRHWCHCANGVEGQGCRNNPLFNEHPVCVEQV